jgi:hypothetical protein
MFILFAGQYAAKAETEMDFENPVVMGDGCNHFTISDRKCRFVSLLIVIITQCVNPASFSDFRLTNINVVCGSMRAGKLITQC